MLFDERNRTRTESRRQGEHEYAFYDSSAWNAVAAYREVVNSWISAYPESERSEMIARFKDNRADGYKATMAELIFYTVFHRCGYMVEVHPKCEHPSRKPDFLISMDGAKVAYVEVTSFSRSQDALAISNIEARIYGAINKIDLPLNSCLGLSVYSRGDGSPATGPLCKAIREWAFQEVSRSPDARSSKIFSAGSWSIKVRILTGLNAPRLDCGAIGVSSCGVARRIVPEISIRQAVERKANRYGAFDQPYVVIVTDCKDEMLGGEENTCALLEAAFGRERLEVTFLESGQSRERSVRREDGLWGTPNNPKNKNVSAVIILPSAGLWEFRSESWQPLLVTHPHATHKFPEGCLDISRYYLDDKNTICEKKGRLLADLLGLPITWPPSQ